MHATSGQLTCCVPRSPCPCLWCPVGLSSSRRRRDQLWAVSWETEFRSNAKDTNMSQSFSGWGGGKGKAKLEEYCAQIFKELLRNRLRLTCGWPYVLSMATIVQILNRWACSETIEVRGSLFWPIAVSDRSCDKQRRMRLNRGGQPDAKAPVKGPQVQCIGIKELKIPPLYFQVFNTPYYAGTWSTAVHV